MLDVGCLRVEVLTGGALGYTFLGWKASKWGGVRAGERILSGSIHGITTERASMYLDLFFVQVTQAQRTRPYSLLSLSSTKV